MQGAGGDDSSEGAAGGYSHLVDDDAELSMLRLAKELAATFPTNVEQLVDLTGVARLVSIKCDLNV
jgi:hypothetical protein